MGDKRLICCDNCGKVLMIGYVIDGEIKVKCRHCGCLKDISVKDQRPYQPPKPMVIRVKEEKRFKG